MHWCTQTNCALASAVVSVWYNFPWIFLLANSILSNLRSVLSFIRPLYLFNACALLPTLVSMVHICFVATSSSCFSTGFSRTYYDAYHYILLCALLQSHMASDCFLGCIAKIRWLTFLFMPILAFAIYSSSLYFPPAVLANFGNFPANTHDH